ncbi:MAG: putative lipid II flippase FtsW [Pseudomonadota bacterium]
MGVASFTANFWGLNKTQKKKSKRTTKVSPSTSIAPATIAIPWLLLMGFGLVMVGSASVALPGDHLTKHAFYLVLSVIAFGVVYAMPVGLWRSIYLAGWAVSMLIAILVLVPGFSHEVNGAKRWISLGGFTLQAAEVAKFGVCLYLAGYLDRHSDKLVTDPKVVFVPIGMVAIVVGLLVAEPDLGSAVVIAATMLGLLFLAGARLRYFFLMLAVGAGLLWVLVEVAPYRMQRLIAFLDPWSVAFGSGYQLTQALIAFGRGEIFGLGLGEGIQKLFYLPEAHNDFIFAVVAEELGALGAIGLILLMSYLVIQLLRLGWLELQRGRHFAGYVCLFVGLLFAFQFLVNIGVNTGALPTKGLTLPFVSYGGNSLIISCALMGLVLRSITSDAPVKRRGAS